MFDISRGTPEYSAYLLFFVKFQSAWYSAIKAETVRVIDLVKVRQSVDGRKDFGMRGEYLSKPNLSKGIRINQCLGCSSRPQMDYSFPSRCVFFLIYI